MASWRGSTKLPTQGRGWPRSRRAPLMALVRCSYVYRRTNTPKMRPHAPPISGSAAPHALHMRPDARQQDRTHPGGLTCAAKPGVAYDSRHADASGQVRSQAVDLCSEQRLRGNRAITSLPPQRGCPLLGSRSGRRLGCSGGDSPNTCEAQHGPACFFLSGHRSP
jgi:hypothetical protein